MSLDAYLRESRYAIEQLLGNHQFYRSLYAELLDAVRDHKSFVLDEGYRSDPRDPDYDSEIARYLRDTVDSSTRLGRSISRLHGAVVSQNSIAGAVFQIAFMGIKRYSARNTTPDGWEKFSKALSKGYAQQLVRFGGGRLLWGEVPLGLAVYAARNQYSHSDEPPTNPVVIEVFTKIRNYRREHRTFADAPAFDASPESIADHLFNLIGWQSYEMLENDLLVAAAAPA